MVLETAVIGQANAPVMLNTCDVPAFQNSLG